MLLILVVTAAASLLPGVTAQYTNEVDITTCPIKFYGKNYTTLSVNITDGRAALCFNGQYVSGSPNDCLMIYREHANQGSKEIEQNSSTNLWSLYLTNLEGFMGISTCATRVLVRNDSNADLIQVEFRHFGNQQAVRLTLRETGSPSDHAIAMVNGEEIDRWNITDPSPNYRDLSGCRYEDEFYARDTMTCDSQGTFINCNATAHLDAIPQINDYCVQGAICTVTGSTIIDYSQNSSSVDDRCAYTLYSNSSVHIVTVFKERRRSDIMFLDRVFIELLDYDLVIQLGPGVKVLVNNTYVDINSVSEEGLDLHQDQTGVTVTIYQSNYSITVFFNGDTAQILLTHPWMLARSTEAERGITEHSDGLCFNSSVTLSDAKSSDFSYDGCEMQYSEPADESINCTTVTQQCHFLNESYFDDCHAVIDPEPYIAACNYTLCHYPDVDGLRCEFLEAYAHACSLKQNHTVDDWRVEANCPAPQAFCNDTHCVDHEFCADGINGQIMCFCRAIFASDFRSNNTLGDPVVCMDGTVSLTLVGCLLEEKGIRYTDLHLNDDSCRGHRDMDHMVTFRLDEVNGCGTVVTANDSVVLYKNTITGLNTSENVANFDEFHLNFSCYHNQPDVQSISFRIKDNSVFQQLVSGSWNYTLKMRAYVDAQHRQPMTSDTEIQLNQRVWLRLMSEGLDENLVSLVTNSCWATNGSSPYEGLRYDLISNGCASPVEPSVNVMDNGVGVSNGFSFNMFHFTGGRYEVYLHCNLELCPNQSGDCQPSCGGLAKRRRRRSARSEYVDESPALISMSWTS
ncbi:alpha-tectorin-like [Dunckerocampus dactyliophorus]|uniref:alpha-tectorin-like n=1 Tax=Dunckerocampus dactyliophorus TaxID=161453 RepID=UPI002406E8C6|nr:alpha-tectorin-like [Dunckerocampus dactyliophorus]